MRFSAEWLEEAPNRAPEERATAAQLEIYLGNSNATLHFRGSKPATAVTVPLYSIAEGLALDWWRLFGGRYDELSLTRYTCGYALPDIRMSFDGSAFEVRSEQKEYTNPDARFWAGQSEVLSRESAETVLGDFIGLVIDRLTSEQVEDTTLALRWARVQASRVDAAEQEFCEAAAALGHDPYNIADDAVADLNKASSIFDDEPLAEFLAGARGKDIRRLFDWIDQVRGWPGYVARLPDLEDLAIQVGKTVPNRTGEESWARGYRRARALRKALNLSQRDRISTRTKLAGMLGNPNFRPAPSVDGIRLLRDHDDRGVKLHLRQRGGLGARSEQLFSLARGVGDVMCFPSADVAPINDVQQAYRQKCGRAFAAEFLAPIHEVRSMHEDGRDHSSIADELGVSELVIEHQLENESRIEQACAA